MKTLIQRIGTKLRVWMRGRYGIDELYRTASIMSLVLLVPACIARQPLFLGIALIPMVWSIMRCFSKNIEGRLAERVRYLQFIESVQSQCRLGKQMRSERKTHRYYRCPNCKTILRVLRIRGIVKISCPKCHHEFIKEI